MADRKADHTASSTEIAESSYPAIEDHGIIGNLETVALVSSAGAINFFCFPHFDSPSYFAALLDKERGGSFFVRPTLDDAAGRQIYLPETNVLLTRFLMAEGILEIMDFMPVNPREDDLSGMIVRIVKSIKGDIPVRAVCHPMLDYARIKPTVKKGADGYCVCFHADQDKVPAARLYSSRALEVDDSSASYNGVIRNGEEVFFCFRCDGEEVEVDRAYLDRCLNETVEFWRDWVQQSSYDGLWRGNIIRSALVLKLMVSRAHGSMVAAPTFGLPEAIGGTRNWDYRYCWIRDSAFTIHALLRLGFTQEVVHYIDWIQKRYTRPDADGSLQLMYRVHGATELTEEELDHLEGYEGSRPVRIGNAAAEQFQLDIYGELIDSVHLANKIGMPISYDGWRHLSSTIEYVIEHWQEPDEGIWEFRGTRQHFIHSRLMCWVAIDRAIKISEVGSFPAPIPRWREERDKIYKSIHEEFWDEELQAFVQYKGAKTMDAAVLLMPMVKFISPVDPRWLSTMREIERQLVTDTFVRRYSEEAMELEGLDNSQEGHFISCSFWYIECLARSGRVAEARLLFEKMLGYASPLGLYGEEIGDRGHHLGNFPQAYSHLALISAAAALTRALRNGGQPF
jgi:GH15 family glucan-1,4-alpha-glucosidase